MSRRHRVKRGLEPGVISVASRERIDVNRAIEAARSIKDDEELANELVRIAADVDRTTVNALLHAVKHIKDDMWRARTLFSLFHQTTSSLIRDLPESAQDEIIALVMGMADEAARTTALRNLPSDLPPRLRTHLASQGEAIVQSLRRLEVALHYETEPTEERTRTFLEVARAIDDEEERGHALATIAPVLRPSQLEESFAAAKAIKIPDLAGLSLIKIATFFSGERRQQAHAEILAIATSIADPICKFGVMAALHDLPRDLQQSTELRLFDLAARFDAPDIRCRAMFAAGDFARDEILRERAVFAGIAAAECVWDEQRRSELFLSLRPGVPSLPPPVRRELARAVEQLENRDIQRELYATLSRFFVYERTQSPGGATRRAKETWDVFISYATADRADARLVAAELKSRGMRVFLSADTIDAAVGSTSWMRAIDEALIGSRALLVLLTQHALGSKWVE